MRLPFSSYLYSSRLSLTAFRHQQPPPNGHHFHYKNGNPASNSGTTPSKTNPSSKLITYTPLNHYLKFEMASSSSAWLTTDDLKTYHQVDREVYSRLVIELGRDIMESMEMISLWLWLEEVGYPDIIKKMVNLPNEFLNAVAEEAVFCLRCIVSATPPPPPADRTAELLMTLGLLEGKHISLEYFHENRARAVYKILRNVDSVFKSVFSDIVQQALLLSNQALNPDQAVMVPSPNVNLFGPGLRPEFGPGVGPSAVHISSTVQQEKIVQFHPIVFGSGFVSTLPPLGTATEVYGGSVAVGVGGMPIERGESSSISFHSTLNPVAEPWSPSNQMVEEEPIPADERTMFVTFSRGYPISKSEVREFFVRSYGDCVENIYMQKVDENVQPLFARIVFNSATKISEILGGKERVKFVIDGRHIMVRRHVSKSTQ